MTFSRRSFRLSGSSQKFDRRTHALRADLADAALAGRLFAPHYAEPASRVCRSDFAALFDKPMGAQTSELLQGEVFALLDVSGGWAWGFCAHDHYVGYIKADALGLGGTTPSRISASDVVEASLNFLGRPYVWGGRGGAGIDCSGLVQRAFAAVGVEAPRDSDMQMAELGSLLAADENLSHGDLVFFPGHVGIMIDGEDMLHATRFHGKTVIEPLSAVAARVAADHATPILARKRVG
jgi:cell wall-associated NlpC family hydrolase